MAPDIQPSAADLAALEAQAVPINDEQAPPIKVAICLPTHDMVPAGFMYDLTQMVGVWCATAVADNVSDLSMNMVQATIVQAGREELAQQAIVTDCTHLLWCDTDHRFPKDALHRLFKHNKDIVGINYATRRFPPEYVAFEEIDTEARTLKKLVTDENSSGLQKAAAIGFGLTLVRAKVFWEMEKPWFDFKWIGPGADWQGEDVHFCRKAAELGYDIWVDADLSKECTHIGQFQYRLEHATVLAEEKENGAGDIRGLADVDRDVAEQD
jgi:hypothetical protein